MKKFLFITAFFCSGLIYPQQEGKVKVLVFSFHNAGTQSKQDFFSEVLAQSISKELIRLNYSADRTGETRETPEKDASGYESYLSFLKEKSDASSADYIVTGSFSVNGGILSVKSDIYIKRSGKIFSFTSEQETGPYLTKTVSEISDKTAYYIDRYIPRMTDEPEFSPKGTRFPKAGSVVLKSAKDDTVIYYTLDNSVPDSVKNPQTRKYSDPIPVTEKRTTIRAYALRDGWFASQVTSQKYTVGDPYSNFHISVSAGMPFFLGKWGDRVKKNDSRMVSARFDFGLGLNSYLRIQADSFLTKGEPSEMESKDESSSEPMNSKLNFYDFAGGMMFQIDAGNYLKIRPFAGGGWFYGYMSEDSGIMKSIFSKPKDYLASKNGFCLTASLSAGLSFGRVEFGITGSYHYYRFDDDDDINLIGASFYTALKF